MRITLSHFFLAVLLLSCSTRAHIKKEIIAAEDRFQDHVGFVLYDPASKRTLVSHNGDKYFTPASNTKIFTLYTALHVLGDSLPAFRYEVRNDSMIIWGTGDPSFLNKNLFDNSRAYHFLASSPYRLFISSSHLATEPWGSGWAWDDYPFSFMTDRSPFPVYGNLQLIQQKGQTFRWKPLIFKKHSVVADSTNDASRFVREIDSNQITYFPGRKHSDVRQWQIPFRASSDAVAEMLSDTLKRQVDEVNAPLSTKATTFFSIPSDSAYAVMMKKSDNHIAEQLLLLCAQQLSDTLDTNIAINFAANNILNDLPDPLNWVDGSGLSRYNLATPRNIVRLWDKLYREVPQNRLFPLLAIGGQAGTLQNYYRASKPFLFGKTGGLSNNVALSGYIITKKQKVLIFSFMNSNFVQAPGEVRAIMEKILTAIRDKY